MNAASPRRRGVAALLALLLAGSAWPDAAHAAVSRARPMGARPVGRHSLSNPAQSAPQTQPPALLPGDGGRFLKAGAAALPPSGLSAPAALETITASQQDLARRAENLPPATAHREAAAIFEATKPQPVSFSEPGQPGASQPSQGPSLQPAGSRETLSSGRAASLPSPAKPRKRLAWKKILLILFLAAVPAFIAYQMAAPHMTPVSSEVTQETQKSPFLLSADKASRVERRQDAANPMRLITSTGGKIEAAAFSRDMRLAVTVSADGSWRLWDLAKDEALRPERYPGRARAAALSEDGGRITLLDQDGTVRILDTKTDELRTLRQKEMSVARHSFSQDGRRLALVNPTGRVVVLDLQAGKLEAGFQTQGEVLTVGATSKGTFVLTGKGGRIKLELIEPGKPEPTLIMEKTVLGATLTTTSLDENGTHALAVGSFLGKAGVTYLTVGSSKIKVLGTDELDLSAASVTDAALDRSGGLGAVLLSDGRLWLWLIEDEELKFLGQIASGGRVFLSADGKQVMAADASGTLSVWPTGF